MERELMQVTATLANAGIRMDVRQPNTITEVFVAELPNGSQYVFSRAGLFKLSDEGKLNIPGIEGSGVLRLASAQGQRADSVHRKNLNR
jgi:hypothetical protein